MDKKFILFLTILFFVIVRVSVYDNAKNNYYWDETAYLHLAKNLHNGNGYSSEIGESFRPPLLPFLISFTTNENVVHSIVLLISILTIIIFYAFVKDLFSENEAVVSILMFITLPLYFFWSSKILTEALSLLLIVTALYLFYLWTSYNRDILLYSSFMIAGLAVLARVPNIAIVISFFAYIFYKEKFYAFKKIKYYISSILFLIALIPAFIIGIKYYGNPVGNLLYQSKLGVFEKDYLFYFKNLIPNLTFLIVPFLYGLFSLKNIYKKLLVVNFYLLVYLFIIVTLLAHNTQSRFFLLAIPPIIIISSYGYMLLRKRFRPKLLIDVIFTLLIIINLSIGYYKVVNDRASTGILIEATRFLEDLPDQVIVCNSIPYCYHFSDKNVTYFPKTKEQFLDLIKTKNIGYLLVDNFHEEPRYVDYIDSNFKLIYNKQNNYKYVKIYVL